MIAKAWAALGYQLPVIVIAIDASLHDSAVAMLAHHPYASDSIKAWRSCPSSLDVQTAIEAVLLASCARLPQAATVICLVESPTGGGAGRYRLDATRGAASLAVESMKRAYRTYKAPMQLRKLVCVKIDSKKWQGAVGVLQLSAALGGDTKRASLQICADAITREEVDHNCADALLLAHYGSLYPDQYLPASKHRRA